MKMKKIALLAVFLLIYLVAIPLVFRDRPYFLRVLTTASVLSVISAGVWLIFYIGRINIGQGAFALVGGYTSAILVSRLGCSFWIKEVLIASKLSISRAPVREALHLQ